jgi:hypothetical protein
MMDDAIAGGEAGATLRKAECSAPTREGRKRALLSLRHPDATAWKAKLMNANIVTDARDDVLRIGFGLYHDHRGRAGVVRRGEESAGLTHQAPSSTNCRRKCSGKSAPPCASPNRPAHLWHRDSASPGTPGAVAARCAAGARRDKDRSVRRDYR